MIKRKKIPTKLYKFHSFNKNSLSSLANDQVWFSKKKYLNDPFEFININYEVSDKKYEAAWRRRLLHLGRDQISINNEINNLLSQKEIRLTSGSKLIEEGLNTIGMYCLTATPDNILMWSHYADSHKGFCIEFDTRRKEHQSEQHFLKVSYVQRYPQLTPLDFEPCGYCEECHQHNSFSLDKHFDCEFIGKSFDKMIGTKSKDWEYEDEYRIAYHMNERGKLSQGFLRSARELGLSVSAIILGPNMPKRQQTELRQRFDKRFHIRTARLSTYEYKMVGCK